MLKIPRPQGLAGSSPAARTILKRLSCAEKFGPVDQIWFEDESFD